MHREEEVLAILKEEPINCILVCSTFMYKDQLEDLTYQLTDSGKPYLFIVQGIKRSLNDWLTEPNYMHSFSNRSRFMDTCKTLVENNLVYEFVEDRRSKIVIHDNLHGRYGNWEEDDRQPWIIKRIGYSKDHEIFYTDGDTEKQIIELSTQVRN